MILSFDKILDLMQELDKVLLSRRKIYLLGGGAMMHYHLKPHTKDIDIVCTKEDYLDVYASLKKIGFEARNPSREFFRFNISEILVRDDFRIDIFNEKVCGNLSLSKGLISRCNLVSNFSKVELYVFSPEDIFVFKSITERDGDVVDSLALENYHLNWEIIFNEISSQIKEHGQDVWITYFVARLEELQEKGIHIPIYKKARKLAEGYYGALEKDINKGNLK